MANPAIEWTKVLTHPLGLAGYVLFLLFGLLARAKHKDEKRWLFPAALAAACIALVGALGLAYLEVGRNVHDAATVSPAPAPPSAPQQQNDHVQQTSSGEKSPNVQGVQGGVSINYSDGAKPQDKQASEKKTEEQKETDRKP